jgi:hypothetical protein
MPLLSLQNYFKNDSRQGCNPTSILPFNEDSEEDKKMMVERSDASTHLKQSQYCPYCGKYAFVSYITSESFMGGGAITISDNDFKT